MTITQSIYTIKRMNTLFNQIRNVKMNIKDLILNHQHILIRLIIFVKISMVILIQGIQQKTQKMITLDDNIKGECAYINLKTLIINLF